MKKNQKKGNHDTAARRVACNYDDAITSDYNNLTTSISDWLMIDAYLYILRSRESDGSAIFWTNPHLLKSWPFFKLSVDI